MSEHPTHTGRKALNINLNSRIYGSFAEIGAGQEVVRWFFRVGAAAGTVAKSMSAYDMAVSDAIYGKTERYVSRARLEAMLEHEHALNRERLGASRGDETAFFAFADTVSAQSFEGNPDCHAWMGIRFQPRPRAPESQITLHVRLLDHENAQQQEALGIVGVNLIYGAFHMSDDPECLMRSLLDELTTRRIEIDMLEFSGAAFEGVDNRVVSLKLVELGLTAATMFSAGGHVLQAADVLHGKPVLVQRGSFRPPTRVHVDMHQKALLQLSRRENIPRSEILSLAEITMNNLTAESAGSLVLQDFLERVDTLALAGLTCVITKYPEHYRVADYLARHTQEPIGMAMGANILREVFDGRYYQHLPGGLLEGMGHLFKHQVRVFVHPWLDPDTGVLRAVESLDVPDEATMLYRHLVDRRQITGIEGYDPDLLCIRSDEVRALIRSGGNWETMVDPETIDLIKRNGLFGCPRA